MAQTQAFVSNSRSSKFLAWADKQNFNMGVQSVNILATGTAMYLKQDNHSESAPEAEDQLLVELADDPYTSPVSDSWVSSCF